MKGRELFSQDTLPGRWRRGDFVWGAEPGVVPDVLMLSLMSWFTHGKWALSLLGWGTLKCCVQKSTEPRRDFTSAGKGDFLGDQELLLLSGHPFLAKGGEGAQPKAQMHTPSCEIPAAVV